MAYFLLALVVVTSIVVVVMMRSRFEGGGGSAARTLGSLPVTRVADLDPAPPGAARAGPLVRVEGTATPLGDALSAPGSGIDCIAHDTWISAFDGSGSPSRRAFQEAVDFIAEDASGKVLVRAEGLRMALERDSELEERSLDELPWADAVLRSQGVSLANPTMQRVTVRQGLILPGASVTVAGVPDPADEAARAAGCAFVLRADVRRGLLLAPAEAAQER